MDKQDKRMDTEPGGEQTQYEGIKTETLPTPKQTGQLGVGAQKAESASTSKSDSESKAAENVRYGQNISESGVGGFTNSTGKASQGGYGGAPKDKSVEDSNSDARTAQGYGSGSGVGA